MVFLVMSLEMLIQSKSNQKKLKCNSNHYLYLENYYKGSQSIFVFLNLFFSSPFSCSAASHPPDFSEIPFSLYHSNTFSDHMYFPFFKTHNLTARIGI